MAKKDCGLTNKAVPLGVDEDGDIHLVKHNEDHSFSYGKLEQPKDGEPIYGEIVELSQSENIPGVFDIKTIMESRTGGPAQVANDSYRKNWDVIFGKSKKTDHSVN
jgi:hypothetical protein